MGDSDEYEEFSRGSLANALLPQWLAPAATVEVRRLAWV